jgi:hypothetical protein
MILKFFVVVDAGISFTFVYLLQQPIIIIMAYLFARPLFFSSSDLVDIRRCSVLVDVVRRTAIGASLHVVATLIYLYFAELGPYTKKNCDAEALSFHISNLAFVLHVSISHRDDLPVRRGISDVGTVLLSNLKEVCSSSDSSSPTPKSRPVSIRIFGSYVASLDAEEHGSVLSCSAQSKIASRLVGEDFISSSDSTFCDHLMKDDEPSGFVVSISEVNKPTAI